MGGSTAACVRDLTERAKCDVDHLFERVALAILGNTHSMSGMTALWQGIARSRSDALPYLSSIGYSAIC